MDGNLGFTLSMCTKNDREELILKHSDYGDILILTHRSGFISASREYKPPLPKGAMRANVLKQNVDWGPPSVTTWERVFGLPRYFYVDIDLRCHDCRAPAVFTAREQKHWYETLRLPTYVEANRCPACRQKRKAERSLREAVVAREKNPKDIALCLAEARARIRCHECIGKGDLDIAISLCRKVAKREDCDSALHKDALFIESKAHLRAGRMAKGMETLVRLIESPLTSGGKASKSQREAKTLLNELRKIHGEPKTGKK